MNTDVRCDNTEPHTFHPYSKLVNLPCDGKTACGEQTHDEHRYETVVRFWCDGICDCGGRGLHGPGAHK